METLETINDAYRYDLTLKEDTLKSALPDVYRYYNNKLAVDEAEKAREDRWSEGQAEQKYFMENTLEEIRNILTKADAHSEKELKRTKKEDLIEIIVRLNYAMDNAQFDL